jgi:hypothetical protein
MPHAGPGPQPQTGTCEHFPQPLLGLVPMNKKRHKFGICGSKAGAVLAKALAALFLCLGTATAASAQIRLPAGPFPMDGGMSSSLTVTATPAFVNFTLVPNGAANGSSAISITTSWSVASRSARISLYAYFTSPGAALSGAGGNNIPAAKVSGSVNGGAFSAFTQSSPFAASSSISIFTRMITGNDQQADRTDTLTLRIDTGGLTLPAGNYAGQLVIQAQMI